MAWQAEQLKKDYKTEVLPLYRKRYAQSELPEGIEVWEGGQVDGGAYDKNVFVYEGVYKLPRALRLWALAHETGHVVTLNEGAKCGLGAAVPEPGSYKKSEYLADLIATHVISEYNPGLAESIKGMLAKLATELGAADEMHPSGDDRVAMMEAYLKGRSLHGKDETAWTKTFVPLFCQVWTATSPPYNGK
jgi:hypothetical protein